MFNDVTMWEHTGFTTRATSNEPVSMKYRGIFDLAERIEDKEGNYQYKLMYRTKEKLFDTIQDALIAWVKKEGKVIDNEYKDEPINEALAPSKNPPSGFYELSRLKSLSKK